MSVACKYELLDFSWDLLYDLDEVEFPRVVRDDTGEEETTYKEEKPAVLQLDGQGIPNGEGKEYTTARRVIISDFYHNWNAQHPDKRVHNLVLDDDILIRGISIVEAKEHAAKRYKSTLAVLRLEEVLAKARPVKRMPVKRDNSNQATFDYMLIMAYELDGIGTVKLTVGVRDKENLLERIQYGISALEPGQELIPQQALNPKKKKAPHKK